MEGSGEKGVTVGKGLWGVWFTGACVVGVGEEWGQAKGSDKISRNILRKFISIFKHEEIYIPYWGKPSSRYNTYLLR